MPDRRTSSAAYDELLEENKRLKTVQPVGQKATIYVIAIVVLASITVAGIVVLTAARPEQNNTPVIATIVGIVTPILLGLLGVAVQQVHLAVNSRLSELLVLTESAAKAKGALSERERHSIEPSPALGSAPVPVVIANPDPVPVEITKK